METIMKRLVQSLVTAVALFALAGAVQAVPTGCDNGIPVRTCTLNDPPDVVTVLNTFQDWFPHFVSLRESETGLIGDVLQVFFDHMTLTSEESVDFAAALAAAAASTNVFGLDLPLTEDAFGFATFQQFSGFDPALSDADNLANCGNGLCGQDTININSVPEPTTLLLLGASLFGFGFARRKLV
jgi:PEP-CTERM motif